jgi:hypothetical protein
MAISKTYGHQDQLVCVAEIAVDADLAAGTYVLADLPFDAIILNASLVVETAVTGMTTPTAALQLHRAGGAYDTPVALLGATAIDAAATTGATNATVASSDAIRMDESVDVEVVIAGTGTATAGRIYVVIEYTRTERAREVR